MKKREFFKTLSLGAVALTVNPIKGLSNATDLHKPTLDLGILVKLFTESGEIRRIRITKDFFEEISQYHSVTVEDIVWFLNPTEEIILKVECSDKEICEFFKKHLEVDPELLEAFSEQLKYAKPLTKEEFEKRPREFKSKYKEGDIFLFGVQYEYQYNNLYEIPEVNINLLCISKRELHRYELIKDKKVKYFSSDIPYIKLKKEYATLA